MFTRDSKVLSRRLTTPLTSVANAVGDVFKPITLNQLIKSLFANSEQGFFYDPNDLSTMFQDAAGTIPVTGAGQPVGLVLDKSKGLVRSVELLADTSFDNPAYWTVGSGWVISGGLATATNASSGIQAAYLLTTGKWYEASITITCTAGAFNLPYDGLGLNVKSVSVTGTYKRLFRATRQTFYACFGSDFSGTIDNISLKEILGNHTFQTTSSARPILRQNATTGAYYLEFDGSDDFLVTNSIDFTSTDKVSLFAGVRKLLDTTQQCLVELSVAATNRSFSLWSPSYANGKNFAFWSKGTVLNANAYNMDTETGAHVVTGRGAILDKVAELRVNSVRKVLSNADQGTGNYGNYPLYIGRRTGTSLPFNGHIYSLIGVGRLTTDAETAAIEKELAKRTGVTLNV